MGISGIGTASNIVATLSTATAGVTNSQPLSTYPNAAVGVSRTNTTPFQFSTALAFPCGAPIDFVLTVTHNGGTNEILIPLSTGSSVGAVSRFDATDTPVPIDAFFGGSSSLTVTGIVSSVAKVTVSLYLTSDSNEDLDIYLIGPDSTMVALATSTGGAFGEGYGTACPPDASSTTFDDAASTSIYGGTPPFTGSYKPEEMLSVFSGKSGSAVNGTWTLAVGNFLATAELECWSLNISVPTCSVGSGACAGGNSVGDGIPDSWRLQYFVNGIPTNGSSCASCDPDGDGRSNLQEFLAGTDPTNSASAFRITAITRAGNDVRVTWTMGNGKTNALQRTAGTAGSYATNNFADIFTVTNTVGPVTNYLDLGAASATSTSRFYRVRLVP